MPEIINKLTPNRDLQCFFFQPSAIAALSGTSATGFTVSGTWRQQFDWAVVEWNRDNVYEHPSFRTLPDGDLSGLTLTYQETRSNCIPLDSALFATVDWPSLRIWATPAGGTETIYYVPLTSHATAVAGSYQCAYADFTLSGTLTAGDYVGLALLTEHHTYQILSTDTLADAATAIANDVNSLSAVMKATVSGATIRLYYTAGATIAASTAGANGNRFGVYSYSTGTETWDAPSKTFANGTSPTQWQVTIDFTSLQGTITPDLTGALSTIPTNSIRKMRWTYAADLQSGDFVRSEFQAIISGWTVTGTNATYSIAGTGSRRIEDHDGSLIYTGTWAESRGNYSGGTVHQTSSAGASVQSTYTATIAHTLYLGLRYVNTGATVTVTVDSLASQSVNLLIPQEDALFRYPAATLMAGAHTVTVTHSGAGTDFYFDFIELASPAADLPAVAAADPTMTLATDWDTLHSSSIAPERTAWILNRLGFTGRANHYVGALWFYELVRSGHVYASATVTFAGTPSASTYVTLTLGPGSTILQKLIHVGDTPSTIATAFALEISRGYTGVWAKAAGAVLTIVSRTMGLAGDTNTVAGLPATGVFTATATAFTGGADGNWRTDLTATPRLNRAVRDWSASYYAALLSYGIDVAASFSMELQHGDPDPAVGIAQMGPSGDPILLPTPSLQTNFSPTSLAFWQDVYLGMASVQSAAGLTPYLQFGEVQWWYFPNDGLGTAFSGMPFYDAWNTSTFAGIYGHAMAIITVNTVNPSTYPDETAYLPTVIGNFTNAIRAHVNASYPTCRFEVLYPTDVNQTTFNQAINYPTAAWTPSALTCLKTECFGFTLKRDLDLSRQTLAFGFSLGFTAAQRSHLVGVGDSTSPWLKEATTAKGKRFESVVLFALDQFCLIGYLAPLASLQRRSFRGGS